MWKISKKQIIGIIIVLILLISIIPIYFFISNHIKLNNTLLKIINYNQQDIDLPIEEQINLYQLLHDNIIYYNNLEDNISINDVTIRDNTVEINNSDSGLITYTFIIDIDSLKQSYTVYYPWDTDGQSSDFYLGCPRYIDMKYPETYCQSMTDNTITATTESFTPRYDYTEDGLYVTNTVLEDGVRQYILATTEYCSIENSAKIKNNIILWLKSLNLADFINNIDIEISCEN